MDEIVSEFLVESYENLDRLDQDLLALERDPGAADLLASIFRTLHTIKGTCGFLGFSTLESVTHAGENLLSLLRDGHLALTEEMATTLLALSDAIRSMLETIESSGEEGDADYSDLVATLERLQTLPEDAGAVPGTVAGAVPGTVPGAVAGTVPGAVAGTVPGAVPGTDSDDAAATGASADVHASGSKAARSVSDDRGEPFPPSSPAEVGAERSAPGAPAGSPVAAQGDDPAASRSTSLADSTIRVDVGLLDTLMTMVGELVLARNQVLQHTSGSEDAALTATSQRLNLITTELQEGVMKTRMQPIGTVWSKLPRVVRDLAAACDKDARLEMEGEETELDKTIIEAIKDPLTHLVRNAVDHGIESPADRAAAGKPEEGRVWLRAFHEGGQVNIEISDDGAGMDPAKLKAKAVEKGVLTEDVAERLSDREAAMLIFTPGFSTAAAVTNVSGRGVGMDVVKTNIEQIGGTVDVSSEPGQGTTFKVKIPLTLAIIPALTVTCSGERFAIPQVSLLELLRLTGEEARTRIERVHGAPVYRLRGQLLPIVDLSHELDIETERDSDTITIVVLQADDCHFGLVVHEVNDTEEIVVKPLSNHLKSADVFAGATIMGDGRVALILDVLALANRSKVVSEAQSRALNAAAEKESAHAAAETQTLLVCAVGTDRRVALPLSEVDRLEEFPVAAIEQAGHLQVVQYRDEILPLVDLASAIGAQPAVVEQDADISVVVHVIGGRRVGVVVDRIIDIVQHRLHTGGGDDASTSTVIAGRVTEAVNLHDVLQMVAPDLIAPALAEV